MNDLQHRLLYILHFGCVEARLLAKEKHNEQIFHLMDILELIPGCINQIDSDEKKPYIEIIRQSFKEYKKLFPTSIFDYTRFLDVDEPPERY